MGCSPVDRDVPLRASGSPPGGNDTIINVCLSPQLLQQLGFSFGRVELAGLSMIRRPSQLNTLSGLSVACEGGAHINKCPPPLYVSAA